MTDTMPPVGAAKQRAHRVRVAIDRDCPGAARWACRTCYVWGWSYKFQTALLLGDRHARSAPFPPLPGTAR